MDGILNKNSLITLALAQPLRRDQQLSAALAAGQMKTDSFLGPLLLQPLVKAVEAAQREQADAESEATALRQTLELELPGDAPRVTLRVPGVSGVSFARVEDASSPGTTVDATTGVVTLPGSGTQATVAITSNGVVRRVTVLRGARAPTGIATRQPLSEAQFAAIGRALIEALQGAARAGDGGAVESVAAEARRERNAAAMGAAQGGAPGAAAKERAGAKRGEPSYSAPNSGAKSAAGSA